VQAVLLCLDRQLPIGNRQGAAVLLDIERPNRENQMRRVIKISAYDEIKEKLMNFSLKKDFRLGVATASTQIEGGDAGSNWNAFSAEGKIKDGSDVSRATQHYRLFREDADLLASLNIRDYRMSLEWARIEPEEGVFSDEVLQHYREELLYLKNLGITPLITFYHFSHPLWFEAKGSFAKRENIGFYLRFIERCLARLGDLCSDYITLNEPNVFASMGYLSGEWPPEETSFFKMIRVMNVFIEAHISAYSLIHRVRSEAGFGASHVSFAHSMRVFTPFRKSIVDRLSASLQRFLFQDGLARACFTGQFRFPFRNLGHVKRGQYADFIALNYYSQSHVRLWRGTLPPRTPVNDLNWEIYPPGLIECCERCFAMMPVPIRISENGTCDNDDRFRARYIAEHLELVSKSALPISHYYHWCFIDNFEWKEGESARFGLVHCDYETQVRTVKQSGHFYADLIRHGGMNDDMYRQYVAGQTYKLANSGKESINRVDAAGVKN
jgi:beta-glucosidase